MSSFSILAIKGVPQESAVEAFDLAVSQHGVDSHEVKLPRKLEVCELTHGVMACLNAGLLQSVIHREVMKALSSNGFEVYFCNDDQTWTFTCFQGENEAFDFNPGSGGRVDSDLISTDWGVPESEFSPYFSLWPKRKPLINRYAKKGDDYVRGDWLQGYDLIRAILGIDVDACLRGGFSKTYEW